MAVKLVAKIIKRMTCRKALERWETKVGNYEVTLQVIGPIAKSVIKRHRLKVPAALHGSVGITYYSNEKANMTGLFRKPVHVS
jgi:hypothetical protein